jgi:hypothetical protein
MPMSTLRMAGTRALFTSIGASVALVMAGALALLGASAMFAFGGWTEDLPLSVEKPPLVFAGSDLAQGGTQTTTMSDAASRIVAPAPVRAPERRAVADSAPAAHTVPAGESAVARVSSGRADLPPTPEPKHTAPAPTAVAPTKSGDRVRKVGESLSSTVQNTGNALAEVTQPLAPPVSAAVQQVLNVVAEIVRRTTGGLSGTLDTLLPKK